MKLTNYTSLVLATLTLLSCKQVEKPDASGTFEAVETIISSEASGRILLFDLLEGDVLNAGELIGAIDSTQLYLNKLQLEQSQKTIQSAQPSIAVQLEAYKKELESAGTDRVRLENLVKEGVASQKQLDDVNMRMNVLQAKIDAQQSVLNTTSQNLNEQSITVGVQLEQVKNQLSKCRIINPINGTVLSKYAEQNEVTAPGKPLYKIADLSILILRVYISGDQLAMLKLNQKVNVFTDDGNQGLKENEGTISWINDKAEFTPKTIQTKNERANLVYAVKIRVKNDGTLKIGMYGEIKL